MKYKKTVLANGLRVVTLPMKDNPTVTVLVMVEAGTRYETKKTNGLSHFLEHMCFKGTEKRTSREIMYELDALGAETNAFTSYDYTGYYAKGRAATFPKLLDVVADVYQNSIFPESELEKERGVICGEIDMYEDLPPRKVQEFFLTSLYGDQPAGYCVLGPKENIRAFTRADFIRYRDTHYCAEKTVIVVTGNIEHKTVLAEVKKQFKTVRTNKRVTKKSITKQQGDIISTHIKKTDQAHIAVGLRALPMNHPDYVPFSVITAILGAGMSSRLFVRLREELGAGYYIKASASGTDDSGEFEILTGTEPSRVIEIITAIKGELDRLRNEIIPFHELEKTKEFLIGNLYMGLEATDALAFHIAHYETLHQPIRTPKDMEKEIRAITPEILIKVAKKYFIADKFHIAVISPKINLPALKKIFT